MLTTPPCRPPGRLQKEHCLCHLATGDMLREAVAAKTALGMQARSRARPNGCGAALVPRDRARARQPALRHTRHLGLTHTGARSAPALRIRRAASA